MEANINQCIFQTSKKLKISPKEIIDIIVTQKMNRKIRLSFLAFTDGACKHNPGPGGWGITYMHRIKDVKIYWSDNGGKKHTTNSEMELTAMKKLLDFVPKGHDYLIHVDSHYVLHSIIKGNDGSVALKNNIPYFSGWMGNWIKNNWKTKAGERAYKKEWQDIIKNIDIHLKAGSTLNFKWVKSHQKGYTDDIIGNNYADELANQGIPII